MGLQFGGHTATNRRNRTIRTATRRRHADRQLLMLPNPHRCRCGGRRRDRRVRAAVPVGGGGARPGCWSAAAGPGRGAGRRQQGLAAVPEGPWDLPRYPWAVAGPGRASDEANRPQHNRPTGVEGAGGTGGPGCGARGRRRGLAAVLVGGGRARAGLEIDHSERSSRVAISRAGRRRPAHTAARPIKAGHATVENQPDPPPPGTPAAQEATKVGSRRPRAHQAARPPHMRKPRPADAGRGFRYPVGYEV